MNYLSIGDLAKTFENRRQNVTLKTELQRLTQELASGRKESAATAVSGDFSPITSIRRSQTALLAYSTATAEAGLFAETMQNALQLVQTTSGDLAPSLLSASSTADPKMIDITSADAKVKFDTVISAFNVQVADRSTFSGAATDAPSLADAQTILDALQVAIAAETTAAGVESVVNDWFDAPGGGFETTAYLGSDQALPKFRLSEREHAEIGISAAHQSVRNVLKGFAMAALVGEGALLVDQSERAALTRKAGERMMTSDTELAVLRAGVGTVEAQIDKAAASNSAESAALEIAETDITGIDPYRTATELEAVQAQLETLYALTARLSRLSLAEYLK